MKLTFILNGTTYNVDLKINKMPLLNEYTLTLGENFIGYFNTVVMLKKPTDANFAQKLNENMQLGMSSKKDLLELEDMVNPKRSKKGSASDTILIMSPLASCEIDGRETLVDTLNPHRKIKLTPGAFTWFKTVDEYDINLYGGFDPFIMILSIISRSYITRYL
jgi:hypothetical protein